MRLVSVVTSTRSPAATRRPDLAEQVVDLVPPAAPRSPDRAGRWADDLLDDHALGLLSS
jgi:hypothetical protein